MFVYLSLKITMKAVLDECNRLAQEEQKIEFRRFLKSSLLQLQLQYENGEVDFQTYDSKQNEILHALTGLSAKVDT